MFMVCVWGGCFSVKWIWITLVCSGGGQKAEPCFSHVVKFVGVQGSGGALAQFCDTETLLLQLWPRECGTGIMLMYFVPSLCCN